MATDYISREAAIEALRPYKVDPFKIGFLDDTIDGFNDGIDTAISALSVMPAADVRSVQVCQKCGEEHVWIDYRPAFCECCGADMRKVIETEQVKEDAE